MTEGKAGSERTPQKRKEKVTKTEEQHDVFQERPVTYMHFLTGATGRCNAAGYGKRGKSPLREIVNVHDNKMKKRSKKKRSRKADSRFFHMAKIKNR